MLRRHHDKDRGSISIWAALTTFTMIVIVGLAADFGGQATAEQRARSIAAEAARAGGERVQLDVVARGGRAEPDPRLAVAAARTYLTHAGQTGRVTLHGTTVDVTVTRRYDCVFLSLIGIRTLPVNGKASAVVVRVYEGTRR